MKAIIGMGSCGIAAGAEEIFELFKRKGIPTAKTGCLGLCYLEPIVEIIEENKKTTYRNVREGLARKIINKESIEEYI
ncbi:MAG: (2Fe-2S) ferredoxin domain-containing protein, partial [bacterium]